MHTRPIAYRTEIIGPLLTSVAAGECCSIVGTSGVGKSNLVQHMLRNDVLQHYLGNQAETLRFVQLDTNMLADWSMWGFFEGLNEALLATLGQSLAPDSAKQLCDAHQMLLGQTRNYALALRQCSEAIALLCAQWRIVLLFDEFDPLFAELDSVVLRNLRGLRDRHKYRLMYVTFTRQPLPSIRDDDEWDQFEPFVELLSLRELGLGPLSSHDAAAEVERFTGRHRHRLNQTSIDTIAALSGGHPALLRALTQQALETEQMIMAQRDELHLVSTLHLECTKIWQQLPGDEQDGLQKVAKGESLGAREWHVLSLKGLVRNLSNGKPALFSPIFAAYLRAIGAIVSQPESKQLWIDPNQHLVQYYGRDISNELTPLEYDMMIYLWLHRGQICPLAAVAKAIHPVDQPVSLHASSELERVRTLARRLHNHLKLLVPDQPVLLSIHRMRGIRLGFPEHRTLGSTSLASESAVR